MDIRAVLASNMRNKLDVGQYDMVLEQQAKIDKALDAINLNLESLYKKLEHVLRPVDEKVRQVRLATLAAARLKTSTEPIAVKQKRQRNVAMDLTENNGIVAKTRKRRIKS